MVFHFCLYLRECHLNKWIAIGEWVHTLSIIHSDNRIARNWWLVMIHYAQSIHCIFTFGLQEKNIENIDNQIRFYTVRKYTHTFTATANHCDPGQSLVNVIVIWTSFHDRPSIKKPADHVELIPSLHMDKIPPLLTLLLLLVIFVRYMRSNSYHTNIV